MPLSNRLGIHPVYPRVSVKDLTWIIHEKERNPLEMRPITVITFKAIRAPFDTLSLSPSAPKWAETRVQTVFHAIDQQKS
jgi:hypothetical protein